MTEEERYHYENESWLEALLILISLNFDFSTDWPMESRNTISNNLLKNMRRND